MSSLVRKMLYYVCIVVGFYLLSALKVVCNEKRERSGSKLLLEHSF